MPANTTLSRPTRRLARSAIRPTTGGDRRKPTRSSQLTTVSPTPRGRPGSPSAVCIAAGTRVATPRPQSLDQHEKVRLIGAAIDRPLSFQELPPEQAPHGMLAHGLPEEVPSRLLGSLADYNER